MTAAQMDASYMARLKQYPAEKLLVVVGDRDDIQQLVGQTPADVQTAWSAALAFLSGRTVCPPSLHPGARHESS